MPLDPSTLTQLFSSYLPAFGVLGVSTPQIAMALGQSLPLYVASAVTVQTTDIGMMGVGAGVGVGMIIPPPVFVGTLTASFLSKGMLGIMTPNLIMALSLGFSQAFMLTASVTVNPLVGVGTGIASYSAISGIGTPLFTAGFLASGLIGMQVPMLAGAIAEGIELALPMGTGIVVISGAPGIIPSAGQGFGKVF